jgi:hypothetical protein
MTEADFVVVVVSEHYRLSGDGNDPNDEHRGVRSEAALLRELAYRDRAVVLRKILPVVLPGHTVGQIPLFLQPHTASHYHVPSVDPTGAKELLGVINGQPVPDPSSTPTTSAEIENPSTKRDSSDPLNAVHLTNGIVNSPDFLLLLLPR